MSTCSIRIIFGICAASVVLAASVSASAEGPEFRVDPSWPKTLPNNWILGEIGGMAIDADDNIWVLQRPRSLTDDERGAVLDPPRSKCCVPAPPVMQFNAAGDLLKAWGGPGEGYEWPGREHGLRLDNKGHVYLSGNAPDDQMFLKLTTDGRFVKQFGRRTEPGGSLNTELTGRLADIFYDASGNELFIADGYGNRRVLVLDADTLAYKRMWGAYGRQPSDEPLPAYNPASPQFASPVHCLKIARDGLVYVCDRANNRIQVFQKDGTFVKEFVYDPETRGAGSVWDIQFWPDANNTYMIIADGTNNYVRVARRSDGQVLSTFGTGGRQAGQFHWVHAMAIDSKGNLYTGEVDTGKRIQKFVPNMTP